MSISEEAFLELISHRAQALLSMAGHLRQCATPVDAMTRPFLGHFLSQSMYIEELLDTYGARSNSTWHGVRSQVACIKRFSDVSYELLHILHATPSYRLLEIEEDFPAATEQALAFSAQVLWDVAGKTLDLAREHGMVAPVDRRDYAEHLPPGRLPRDREARKSESTSEIVTRLATAFLNLAAESKPVHQAGRARPHEYAACIPDPISEESLRNLQHRFHNLQSLYDTWVSATETEGLDAHLPVLRGHISVVFHLLKTATELVHYYERHVVRLPGAGGATNKTHPLVDADLLLTVVMNYSLAFASQYISGAREMCQDMLRRYAEITEIEVPVPRYRGFHVRPSTLVAKIVLHYGSEVRMLLENEEYDASTPLEIFRANEHINAQKRRWLAQEIAALPGLAKGKARRGAVRRTVRRIVMALAEQGKVVIYKQPLELPRAVGGKRASLLACVVQEIARLQATGKIDIQADLTIRFRGDRRVLEDIALLAQCGYGEDNFGNNTALPKELSYLRR